jgi:sugar lactone lactonase YvrE
MKRLATALVLLGVVMSAPAATAAERRTHGGGQGDFPATFPLPNGWMPEGITIGGGPFAYFGSRADGSIYRADLRTGEGRVISQGPGTPSVGLKIDSVGRLFVAGGTAGDGRVISARTGEVLKSYQFTTGESFVNDVVLHLGAAWFTDSRNPALYKVSLRRGLPDEAVSVPLSGDIEFVEGNNANGIAPTPDGRGLLVVQGNLGLLFRVNPATGETTQVDLGGAVLTNGDGLLLQGRTLFVVQNRLNQVAVVRLNERGTAGRIVQTVTDPSFDVPTTVAAFDERLYLPNARFNTPPEPTTPYNVVSIPRP